LENIIVDKCLTLVWILLIQSLLCTLPVNFEDVKRIEEYNLFTIPRVLEGLFDLFEKLGYIRKINGGLYVLFAVSMAILLVLRTHFSKDMPRGFKRQLGYIFTFEEEEEKKEDKKEIRQSSDEQ
jgi:hypothetical protein